MINHASAAITVAAASVIFGCSALAGEDGGTDAIGKAMSAAKVSLVEGLTVSESAGRPLSGKFEYDEGRFQLSVYTSKGGAYYEVVVDHMKGAVAEVEKISEADDLRAATSQAAAMAHVKVSLKTAVESAERRSPGYHAMSVVPEMRQGHATAIIELTHGGKVKTVTEILD